MVCHGRHLNPMIRLSIDEYISWRMPLKDISISLISGDIVVLTVSPNGIDAYAEYLNVGEKKELKAHQWFTTETMGNQSMVQILPNNIEFKIADDNWKPTPLKP